jgi:hypothetical protein
VLLDVAQLDSALLQKLEDKHFVAALRVIYTVIEVRLRPTSVSAQSDCERIFSEL